MRDILGEKLSSSGTGGEMERQCHPPASLLLRCSRIEVSDNLLHSAGMIAVDFVALANNYSTRFGPCARDVELQGPHIHRSVLVDSKQVALTWSRNFKETKQSVLDFEYEHSEEAVNERSFGIREAFSLT